jgi:hypothetical protein
VWYSICQCVKQVGFENQQSKRERERIRRIASLKSSSQPLLERDSTLALFHLLKIGLVVVLSLILCSDGDLLRHCRGICVGACLGAPVIAMASFALILAGSSLLLP